MMSLLRYSLCGGFSSLELVELNAVVLRDE